MPGAFGENFPYSNFHDLNMDWIVKIAKDFLDQYTSIQTIITDGETSLQTLTSEGLNQLSTKAEEVQEALQNWYDEHSEDIEEQLRNAVEEFRTTAIAIAESTIESIPADYTELTNKVLLLYQNAQTIGSKTPVAITAYNLTMGKTLSNGAYVDSAQPVANLRAASPLYYHSGDYISYSVLTDYKIELDFYDDNYIFKGYKGWLTGSGEVKPLGSYFRLLVGGDSDISEVYNTIANLTIHSNMEMGFNRTNELIKQYGAEIELHGWINGQFPNPAENAIWSNAEYKYAPWVDIIPGATYEYTGVFNTVCGAIFYDENKNMLTNQGTNSQSFTAPLNAKYASIGSYGLSSDPHLYVTGANWNIEDELDTTEPVSFTQLTGAITPSLTPNPDNIGARADITVSYGEKYIISGYCYVVNTYPVVIFLHNNTLISYINGRSNAGAVNNLVVNVPNTANRMIVNGKPYEIIINKQIVSIKDAILNINNKTNTLYSFSGKRIVWFGTSIPAGGWFGWEHPQAYPQQVGNIINAEVVNEAIGSSSIHCKDPAWITTDNPYGFDTNFEKSSRCLTNSLDEMQWIIEHWNSSIWTANRPSEMTEWLAERIRDCSYERKIDKYLTNENFPDMFVFDHGFNDTSDTNNYYNTYGQYSTYTFRGGMNFLIKRILDFNPYATIVIIGNYTTTRDVPQMQTTVATDWDIPIYKQWENLGLSLTRTVSANGIWMNTPNGYVWNASDNTYTYSMKDRLVPDKIHPWTNPTGKVIQRMAALIAKWLTANVTPY